MEKKLIRIAHSPDADDAFMFYALANDVITDERFRFEHVLSDIETLNQKALDGVYEVSAISYHAYPYVADKYALMTCGGSIGENYGPIVVSKKKIDTLKGKTVAIPGRLTTARLALLIYENQINEVFMNFDEITDAVKSGKVDAGLIIHEGQLTYEREGLELLVDLGQWWKETTGLPLPLGGNVVRRDIEEKVDIARLIKMSIEYSISHEDEALDYALSFGRGLNREEARKFVRMYVNERTIHLGSDGMKAAQTLLDLGYEKGILDKKIEIDWIDV
ncbi:MAG: ABC transporter substrate-binding protein [Actinobacteria bacterium]|nr:ABC transporter substrate-binding protein [Actinomycetota bacterium]